MLQQLLEARRLGLAVPATLLVKAYLDANGVTPKGFIARALDVSERTVERALSELKRLGISYQNSSTGMTHDHASKQEEKKEAATPLPDGGVGDPLAEQLIAYGVLPWCVSTVLQKVPRDVIDLQLKYHAHRLAAGFVERTPGGAAKMLFRACLGNFAAPQGYPVQRPAASPSHDRQHHDYYKLLVGKQVPDDTLERNPPYHPSAPATMSREGALSAVRLGLRSRIPALRDEAIALAARFDIDITTMAG